MASPELWAPWVAIRTPQVSLPFYVRGLEVHAEEGMHQWAQLTVRYHMPEAFRPAAKSLPPELWWAEGSPVQISYGARRGVGTTFTGYVVSPELCTEADPQELHTAGQMIDIRYTLLGASARLQSARSRTWRQCSAAYIAGEIAAEAGLVGVTSPHPRVFETRMQSSQSDFSFLQDIATEVGWRLAVDGTMLSLTDPRQPLVAATPYFSQHGTAGRQDTMQTFTAVVGELDPAGQIRAQHAAMGVSGTGVLTGARDVAPRQDPVTGQAVAPVIRRQVHHRIVESYADAQAVTAAAATRDLWWVHSTATVDGDVRLRPGCVVLLDGDAVTPQHQGEWMTRTAHHRIWLSQVDRRLSTYHVDLELGRDQVASLSRLAMPHVPSAQSVLVGNRWISRGGA